MQPTTPTACFMVLELSFGIKIPVNMKPSDHQSTAIRSEIYYNIEMRRKIKITKKMLQPTMKDSSSPRRSSVPLGFVSPNIQANETAIVAIRTAKNASNFLTP